jgi:hypothetical protein
MPLKKRRQGTSVTLRVVLPLRYLIVERDGNDIVDTASEHFRTYSAWPGKRLTPYTAVLMLQAGGCDFYPYRYRRVRSDDPAASIGVYRAAPDYVCVGDAAAVARDCKRVATFAIIYPTCCFCGGPMEYGEQGDWLYGYRAWPLADDQCCSTCHDAKVVPARKAQWPAEEARCRSRPASR